MSIQIRKCLYVGLGGTGMNALLHTKKMFVETYGEVPPMIGFLGVDADQGAFKKTLPSKYGNISLSPNEQIHICVDDAKESYETNQQHFSWVPKENIFSLTSMTKGAGQIRTNGRFALTCNFNDLTNMVKNVAARISNPQIVNNIQYVQNNNAEVEVHMVFSVGGGTGAGTFLNMAYIIKHALQGCRMIGYAVLPDVFEQMSNYSMERVKPNSYGSLWDLDWFMHFDGTEKHKFNYVTHDQDITGKPFDAVFLIDNKNERGDTHTDVSQLAEMISQALVISAGELADASASVTDNVEKSILNGDGMVANKRAWVSSMGACEIIFRGKDLSELDALINAQRLIQRMMNSCHNANQIANNWIDSPEVNIRENGGSLNDNVIDFLLTKAPDIGISNIADKTKGRSEVDAYLSNTGLPTSQHMQAQTKTLSDRVKSELNKSVKQWINQECGVGLAKDVLNAIKGQVNVFLSEMRNEKQVFETLQPQLDNAVNVAAEDLKGYNSRFFKTKTKQDDLVNDLCAAAEALTINHREVLRRNHAITFFNGLLVEIEAELLKVNNIVSKIKAVNDIYINQIAALTNGVNVNTKSFFQIDLAQTVVNSIKADDNQIQIKDFLKTLSQNQFYDIDNMNTAAVAKAITDYTQTLPTAQKWAAKTIDDMMASLDKETPGELDNVLRRALAIAMPLLNINTRGHKGGKTKCDASLSL